MVKRGLTRAYLWEERVPLLIILGFFFLSCFLVAPLRNVPIIDDWTYAWSVEHLLKTGRLAVLDWSAHYPIFQVLWSSPWALLFGFSFGVLRLSTVAVAALGCIAFYLTLRELDLSREYSLLGALLLATNPVFFPLSFSFMTDIPFLSMVNFAVLCYVAGVKREQPAWLWVGGIFAVAAFLSRQIGLFIPMALLPCVLSRKEGWRKWLKQVLPIAASFLVIVLLWLLIRKSLGQTSVMESKFIGLRYFFRVKPLDYLDFNFNMLLQIAFAIFPLLVAGVSFKPKWWPVALAVLVVVIAVVIRLYVGNIPSPLHDGGTWSFDELASGRGLIQGKLAVQGPAHRFGWPARILMLISLAVLFGSAGRWLFETRGRTSRAVKVMIASGLLQLIPINILWLYYDRYYVVLMPWLIYLGLKLTLRTGFSRVVAWSSVAVLAFVSISGTWDVLRFNGACLEAVDYLHSTGVPIAEIDAGYPLTGWLQYAHPENLPPGSDPAVDAPWVTSAKELPYVISNTPLPEHDIIKEISWRGSIWAVTNRVYILHKQGHSPGR